MIAHPSQKTALWLLIIISFFCIPFNALSEVFSPDNLSPESLREDLQIIAGDEDISWITENNLPFVHTPNSHLHSLLVDYAIIREINSQGLPHNLISMTNRGYLEGYLQLYNNVGEGIKLYMGDIYIDHLEENTTSSLLDYLKEKSANWIGNQIENSLTGTQSNLVSYGWGKYNTIDAIANAFIESSNSNSLEFIESLWNLTATLTGSSAAGVGAYMNFLFSTIDMFEEEATKNRIRLYAALSYKSETINDFTRHYYQPNNDIETYTLYTYSPIYTFLNQPQLESNYFDNIGEEIAYQEIVSNHLSAYGLNNYTLQQDAIQDILLFIGPSFVSFIDKYRAMLDEASAASWAELETELYDLIHAEVQRANYIRYNYSYRGDDIDKKSVLLAYNGTDTFYLLNNSSERLHNTYLLDTDWIHEDTNHKNIAPEEYTFFQVEKDNLPEELHYTLFNVPDQFQLTTDDFKNFFAQINISAEKYITYSDIHFSSKNNAFAYPEEVTFHWDFGDGETASGGSATHQYKNPGDYIVTLSLIRNGQPYKVTKEVRYIKPNDATIPTDPTIEASPDDHYTISDTITLTATSTSVDSESTIEYYWYTKNTEDQNAWFHVGSTLEVQPTDPDKETYYARAENIHGSSSLASVTLHNNGFYSVGDSVIEPYQDENGNWINTFNICGAIGGNTTLKGGTLDLAGCILVIDGDLIQSGGILNVNGGKLIVKGDYRIQGETSNGNTYFSDGKLNMSNEADYILVEENFIMDSSYQHDGGTTNALLYAGTLEVRGNFTQKSSDPSTFYSPYENFEARGTHKVLLSGTGPQTVSFEDAAPSYSHFNILEITNPDPTQITFNPAEPTTSTIIYDAPPLSLRDLNIGEVGLTLPMDLKIVLSEGASFELSNQVLNLNGHTLTVEGDFIHSGGTLNVNGGKLIVKGDYRIQNKTADGAYTYSTGKLNMVNEADHILVEGDFVMDSSYQHDGGTTNAQLYAGTLELKGNFTQKSTDTEGFFPYENFEARGTHKVLLSGSGPQSVSFEDAAPSYSHFNILEITNSDPTQIAFKPGEPTTSNIVYNANSIPLRDLYIGKVGLTLPMDMNIVLSEGRTFKLYNQVLNLNGHTLTVEGDFIHSGGTLNVNGGKLIVKGDYRIQNKTADGAYTYSTGKLNMANEADHILVEGDFVMDSMYQHDGGTTEALLYAGTLEVKGNFTQQSTTGGDYYSFENFEARGTHKVLLSGTGPQAISFEDLRPSYSHFNILEIKNPDPTQISFSPSEPTTSNIIYAPGLLPLRDLDIGKIGITLPRDIKVVLSEGKTFGLYGQTLNLNGHTLTVEGDFLHSGGTLNVNGGKLIVKGDYRIQNKTADGAYTYSAGKLNMANEADHILVEGDFVMDSMYQHDGGTTEALLYAGTLEVKGNFTQQSTTGGDYYSFENFEARGTHKVLLSGTGPQAISFEDLRPSYSHFNILEIKNPDPTQISFSPSEPTTSNIIYAPGLLPLRDLDIGKIGITLPRDIKVVLSEGKTFGLYGQTLNLNGHTLTVEGDFLHSGGTLNVNGGKLIVKGDYRIQNKTADGAYTYSAGKLNMANEADYILVEGDFVMDSSYEHDGGTTNALLYAGTLVVQKNFTQKSTDTKGSYPYENFEARGTHKVLLSGAGPQTISFEDASPSYSHFNELLLTTNTLKTFTTKVAVTKLFNHQRKPFILTNEAQSYFVDYDSDGVKDHQDSYPLDPNQSDFDQDNDGVPDNLDAFPYDPTESVDTDGDGIGNNADTDDDNDGVIDSKDPFPLDPNEWADTDNDGQGDNADTDDDNDGVSDNNDDDPMNPYLCEDIDADTCNDCSIGNDGFGPLTDYDPDNDGLDTDSNGICDLGDYDDDGDGVLDEEDNCPLIVNPDQEDENGYQDDDDIGDACEELPKKSMMCFPVKAQNGNVAIICL